MSLSSAFFDSLPYIDPEPTPEERAAAESLIAAEQLRPRKQDGSGDDADAKPAKEHPRLPPSYAPSFTPALAELLARVAATYPARNPLSAIDQSRYLDPASPDPAPDTAIATAAVPATAESGSSSSKATQTGTGGRGRGRGKRGSGAGRGRGRRKNADDENPDRDVDGDETDPAFRAEDGSNDNETALASPLRRLCAAHAYLASRRANLALLDRHGTDAWLLSNYHLEGKLRALETELEAARHEVDAVAAQRRRAQEEVAGEVTGLEAGWRTGVERMVGVGVEVELMRARVRDQLRLLAAQ